MEHHRARGVDDFYAVLFGRLVGRWRLAVGTKQNLCVRNGVQLLVVDGFQSHLLQTFTLAAVVYDVAQTEKCAFRLQFLLGLSDGTGDAEAKSRVLVYLYLHLNLLLRCGDINPAATASVLRWLDLCCQARWRPALGAAD